ncbi:MAG: hypothetical protein IPN66_19550 [Candidatus Competibacteraceae bacterium]|nr:hypothetical protein [Candidatus Competibacteraceae bacterium]
MLQKNIKNIVLFGLFELVLVLVLATFFLQLWCTDLRIPFNYQGDTLWFLVPVKGMLDNGWTYNIPQLSAPFSLSAAAFPSMTNLDWAIMKVISLFINDAGGVLNIFWLFSIVLTAWSATLAFRLLGIGNWLALGLGLIYAFLPFALMRNTAHISLVFYCVPLLSLFTIHLMRGDEDPQANTVRKIGYLAALAQGFNYIYFSFFAVILFFFGGWFGYRNKRSWTPLRNAAIASGILILSSALNLLPSYISWQRHGKPPNADFKVPQEAEIYGLKLRKMLVPHEANITPIFSYWSKRDYSIPFPNENENISARLGPFAAVGFLFLLAISFQLVRFDVIQEAELLKPIASLALFSLLVTTVGGFGAIFNQLISPDIRCYNRFSVFIAFFSIAGLGVWFQVRLKTAPNHQAQMVLASIIILFILFSLYDQSLDARPLSNGRPNDEQLVSSEQQFVKQLEARLSPETAIYQLPITSFPGGMKERMFSYDHIRPYLWSSYLHWSWPSFSQRHRSWLAQVEDLEGKALAEALILSKFRVVWVDRFGYSDNGARVISSLIAAGANDMLPGAHPRYAALDLESITVKLRQQLGADEFSKRQAVLLDAPDIDWISGFYPEEYHPTTGKKFRWSQTESIIEIHNPSDTSKSIVLSFLAASVGKQGNLTILTERQQIVVPITDQLTPVELPIPLEPNAIQKIKFKSDIERVPLPPGETRDLHFHFYLMDLHLKLAPAST